MHAAPARRERTTITVDQVEALHQLIEKQKAQLVLALGVLVALGFDLADFSDLMQ